jgi:hypothetical protein
MRHFAVLSHHIQTKKGGVQLKCMVFKVYSYTPVPVVLSIVLPVLLPAARKDRADTRALQSHCMPGLLYNLMTIS